MNLFPLEDITWSKLESLDDFIHNHHFLYESRLFGVIAGTGFLITLPFFELAFIIEHFVLAIFNEMQHFKNNNDVNRWARETHVRNFIQHISGATIMPLAFAVNLIMHSLKLLDPYIYGWSKPNDYFFTSNWQESQTWSESFCYDTLKILNRPNCTVNRIEKLITELFSQNSMEKTIGFKNGCFFEKDAEKANQYLILDKQHHRIWLLNKPDIIWQITELVLSTNPFMTVETPSNPISFPLYNFNPIN